MGRGLPEAYLSKPLNPPTLAGGKLDRYFHVCAFFNSQEEQYRVLLPFVKEGIEAGEKALHIWAPKLLEDHRHRLQGAGVDVPRCEHSGQLEVLSTRDVYLQDGHFEPGRMLATVEHAIAAGRAQGFPRTRLIGHMEWALEGNPGSDRLLEFEIRVNDVLARSQQPACCVYDVNQLSAGMMLDLMRAHPLSIVGGVLYENPFFTPPEVFLEELRQRGASGHRTVA